MSAILMTGGPRAAAAVRPTVVATVATAQPHRRGPVSYRPGHLRRVAGTVTLTGLGIYTLVQALRGLI